MKAAHEVSDMHIPYPHLLRPPLCSLNIPRCKVWIWNVLVEKEPFPLSSSLPQPTPSPVFYWKLRMLTVDVWGPARARWGWGSGLQEGSLAWRACWCAAHWFPSCAPRWGVLVPLLSCIVPALMSAPCLIINASGWGPRFRQFPWSASKVDKATNGTCVCFATGHISKGGGPRARLRTEWGGRRKDLVAGIPERAPPRQSLCPEDLPGGARMTLFHHLKARAESSLRSRMMRAQRRATPKHIAPPYQRPFLRLPGKPQWRSGCGWMMVMSHSAATPPLPSGRKADTLSVNPSKPYPFLMFTQGLLLARQNGS